MREKRVESTAFYQRGLAQAYGVEVGHDLPGYFGGKHGNKVHPHEGLEGSGGKDKLGPGAQAEEAIQGHLPAWIRQAAKEGEHLVHLLAVLRREALEILQ